MYQYTNSEFALSFMNMAESVERFHMRFSVDAVDMDLDAMKERVLFLTEEVGEHVKEVNQGIFDGALEELCDVIYVAMGTIQRARQLGKESVYHVIRKNDDKTSATHYRHPVNGKVTKKEQA